MFLVFKYLVFGSPLYSDDSCYVWCLRYLNHFDALNLKSEATLPTVFNVSKFKITVTIPTQDKSHFGMMYMRLFARWSGVQKLDKKPDKNVQFLKGQPIITTYYHLNIWHQSPVSVFPVFRWSLYISFSGDWLVSCAISNRTIRRTSRWSLTFDRHIRRKRKHSSFW